MSHTDKTDPSWTKAQFWVPAHHPWCRLGWPRSWEYDCDLPAEVPKGFARHRRSTRCRWEPDIPFYYSRLGRKLYGRKRYIRETANQHERRARARWQIARRALLASADVDEVTLPDPRHRHSAWWECW